MNSIKRLLSALCVIFLFITSGCSAIPGTDAQNSAVVTSTDAADNGKLVSAKVTRVVDGDTIKVQYQGNDETVRFLLIDTPETHHPRLGVQPFGPEASKFTHQLLDGETVQLELAIGGGRDKYGRMLAYVYHDGQSVEEALLKKGLARVAYVYPPNTKYVDEYRSIQKEAQNKAIGIWSVENYARKDGYHPEAVKGGNPAADTEESDSSIPSSHGFPPDENGGCSGEIKGNISSKTSKIYHVQKDPYYKVTKAEVCYKTVQAAEADGFRAPK